jgi:hypothetical protein
VEVAADGEVRRSAPKSKQLILANAESVQTVAPRLGGRPGAEVIFTNGTAIEADESAEDLQGLL